jgi:hypothetical protein
VWRCSDSTSGGGEEEEEEEEEEEGKERERDGNVGGSSVVEEERKSNNRRSKHLQVSTQVTSRKRELPGRRGGGRYSVGSYVRVFVYSWE